MLPLGVPRLGCPPCPSAVHGTASFLLVSRCPPCRAIWPSQGRPQLSQMESSPTASKLCRRGCQNRCLRISRCTPAPTSTSSSPPAPSLLSMTSYRRSPRSSKVQRFPQHDCTPANLTMQSPPVLSVLHRSPILLSTSASLLCLPLNKDLGKTRRDALGEP